MEYEIADDPQGLPEWTEGDRRGGLREERIFFRTQTPQSPTDGHDNAYDEDSAVKQLGEAA